MHTSTVPIHSFITKTYTPSRLLLRSTLQRQLGWAGFAFRLCKEESRHAITYHLTDISDFSFPWKWW